MGKITTNEKMTIVAAQAFKAADTALMAVLDMAVNNGVKLDSEVKADAVVMSIGSRIAGAFADDIVEAVRDGVKMKVVLDEGAHEPRRAHETDAGLDIRCRDGFTVPARGCVIVDTGVHVELPAGTCGQLWSKSGLNTKHAITTTGLIDEGYTGQIRVAVYNHSDRSYTFQAGDAITQLVVVPCTYVKTEVVESFDGETDRGDDGFGSTGR